MRKLFRWLWHSTVALIVIGQVYAWADYTATQGSGTNFGSVVVSGVHYVQQFVCDLTVPARCATVSAGGAVSTSSAQSGTWTVQPGNTANTTAWKVDGSAVTQPVSGSLTNISGTISLPTGASSAANQTSELTKLDTLITNTSSAVPTIQSGVVTALISCDSHVFKHITTATDTVAVPGVTAKVIYICGWRSRAAGTATWYLENTASTNNNCSSTLTQITGVATEAANTGEVMNPAFWSGLKNTSGNGLCINSTGTGGVDIDIWYTQF